MVIMKCWFNPARCARFLDNRGVAAIEYALIASLVALALLTSLVGLGGAVSNQFNGVDNGVGSGTKFES
jgi:Flp pilus assembly pilin Flp